MRHGGVEVVDLRLERGLEQRRVEVRRAQVHEDVGVVLLDERGDRVDVAGVDLLGHEARVVQLGDELGGALAVVVSHDHLLEPLTLGVAALGDRGDGLTHTTGADNESLHVVLLLDANVCAALSRGAPSAGAAQDVRIPPRTPVRHIV